MSETTSQPVEIRSALRSAALTLATEFDGTFSMETIELFLTSSYDQFAAGARVMTFLP